MIIEPFFGRTDTDEIRTLKHRCVAAMRHAARGRIKDHPLLAGLAGRIDHLHAMRRQLKEALSPKEVKELKILIAYEEAWLAPALLEAAEQGALLEVAQLLARRRTSGAFLNPGQYRVIVAYSILLSQKKRPPFIGELLERVGIKKPKRTKENTEEWFRLDRRERVVRKTLKHFNLPLSTSKRGRQKR